MKIKDLQKITIIYEQIKSLDEEIMKIEKMGMSIASSPTTISFCLKVVDENAKKEEGKANLFDEDGSLKRPDNASAASSPSIGTWSSVYNSFLMGTSLQPTNNESDYTTKIDRSVSDKDALLLLGVILSSLHEQRSAMMEKIASYGVNI